jgi:hypothetical protein
MWDAGMRHVAACGMPTICGEAARKGLWHPKALVLCIRRALGCPRVRVIRDDVAVPRRRCCVVSREEGRAAPPREDA